jgi:HK97 family phage portal protein
MKDIFANDRRNTFRDAVELKFNKAFSAYVSSPDLIELSDDDLRKVAKEGYRTNAIVKACIDKIARVASTFPIITVRETGGGRWEEIFDHASKKLLDKPQGNVEYGRSALFHEWVADYVLNGFSLSYISSPQRGESRGVPKYIYPLRAANVEIVTGTAFTPIREFIYRDVSEVRISHKEAFFVKNWNPTDYWFGASNVYDIGHLVDLLNYQVKWNASLLKNKGVPPYYLYSDSYVTPDAAEQISKLAAEMLNGYTNAGKPWVQHSGLKLEKLGFNASDIDWREGMWMISKLISIGLGVPPSLIFGGEGTSDRKGDEKMFYLETMIPIMQTFLDAFNNKIMPMIEEDDNVKLIIDRDQILAIREDMDRLHNRERADYLSGIKDRNEARREIGYEPYPENRIVEPVNVAQVGDDIASSTEKEKPLLAQEKLPNQKG